MNIRDMHHEYKRGLHSDRNHVGKVIGSLSYLFASPLSEAHMGSRQKN